MKTTKRFLLITIMMVLSIQTMQAQTYEWQKPMQSTEIYKGTITKKYGAGSITYFKDGSEPEDLRSTYTLEELYSWLEDDAIQQYGSNIVLRQFKANKNDRDDPHYYNTFDMYFRAYTVSAIVATPAPPQKQVPKANPLTQALNKALQNIREGSRLALDQIRVVSGTDKEDFKDKIIEVLLDNGYKVVAKEQLEKLYKEQQDQLSGLYNENTTVQGNNFSAVGYFVNVKVTETSIRVQVVNVSTGEYEGNATVNF